ncbi:hypothetical protein MUK42_21934 [Musa troglodytarum]|uniref:Uncharacterized protein n=1 Tax=Musa troglodytarum TaxID=320322 RepID=A0A9E7FX63_9LILI|nr:hypothetical protein MUK42_21934 [Musa troglodytarum]
MADLDEFHFEKWTADGVNNFFSFLHGMFTSAFSQELPGLLRSNFSFGCSIFNVKLQKNSKIISVSFSFFFGFFGGK